MRFGSARKIFIGIEVVLLFAAYQSIAASPAPDVANPTAAQPAAPSTPSSGGLTAAAAQLLYGNSQIPLLGHVTRVYQNRATFRCTAVWNKMMAQKPRVIPVRASLTTLVANARKIGLSVKALKKTLGTFLKNQPNLDNQRYVGVIDYGIRATSKRLFIVDLQTGQIKNYITTNGKNSDPHGTGIAEFFSNLFESKQSSLGCFVAYGEYRGKKGRRSLILHGLESSNDNACARSIVMHPAGYADSGGRSWGCPAVPPQDVNEIFGKIGGGGVICSVKEGYDSKTNFNNASPDKRKSIRKVHLKKPKKKIRHHRRRRHRHG